MGTTAPSSDAGIAEASSPSFFSDVWSLGKPRLNVLLLGSDAGDGTEPRFGCGERVEGADDPPTQTRGLVIP